MFIRAGSTPVARTRRVYVFCNRGLGSTAPEEDRFETRCDLHRGNIGKGFPEHLQENRLMQYPIMNQKMYEFDCLIDAGRYFSERDGVKAELAKNSIWRA